MIATSANLLIMFALILNLSQSQKLTLRCLLATVACALLWLPVANSNAHQYLSALQGQISIMSLFLLSRYIISQLQLIKYPKAPLVLYLLIIVAGLYLYCSSLGLSMLPAYSWGYQGSGLIIAGGVIALIALWRGQVVICQALILCTLAYGFSILASNNYWDYLLDPGLFIFACYRLLHFIFKGPTPHA